MRQGNKLATASRVRMHGARTRLMHAHAGRGSVLVAVVVAALVFNLGFPRLAMADWTTSSTVERGTNAVTGEPYITVTGKPCNSNFYAAARACGYSDARISGFTDVQRAKLSNAETGGSFYLFALTFSSGLEWSGVWGEGFKAFLDGLEGVFGVALYTNTWTSANVSSELLSEAKRDIAVVLGGGDLGGSTSDSYTLTLAQSGVTIKSSSQTVSYLYDGVRYYMNEYVSSGVTNPLNAPASMTFSFSNPDVASFVSGKLSQGWHMYCYAYGGNGGTIAVNCVLTNATAVITPTQYTVGDVTWTSNVISLAYDEQYDYYVLVSPFGGNASVSTTVTSAGSFTVGSQFKHVDNASQLGSGFASPRSNGRNVYTNYEVSGPPVAPPNNNWPVGGEDPVTEPPTVPDPPTDNPTEPTPPDLPNPGNDVPVDPYEPDPTPNPPTTPTYDPDPTGTDYTVYLLRIIELLRTINDTLFDGFADLLAALRTHCDHIREALHDESLYLGSKFATVVHNEFVAFERWLQSTWTGYLVDQFDYIMGQQFQELEDYLHELFEWLAGQFDFTYGGSTFDDSSIITWLRKIYGRLGGSAPNPGTGDDPDEGFDFWAWLINLIASRLGGILTDLVGDIGGFLSAVASKFPFSISGDIVLYLTALDAQRTTPVIDITIPAINGWWSAFTYRIDLSPFDSAMAVVRSMILIYWGFVLVMKTDWLFGVFDFATDFVTGFVRRVTAS